MPQCIANVDMFEDILSLIQVEDLKRREWNESTAVINFPNDNKVGVYIYFPAGGCCVEKGKTCLVATNAASWNKRPFILLNIRGGGLSTSG